MKRHCIVGTLSLAFSIAAFGESADTPRIGTCASFDSGSWSARGALPFVDCLDLIRRQGDGHLSIGSWQDIWIAHDGLGVMISHDEGRSWQAYRGAAPEAAAATPAPPLNLADGVPAESTSSPLTAPVAETPAMAAAPEQPPETPSTTGDAGSGTVVPTAMPADEAPLSAPASSGTLDPATPAALPAAANSEAAGDPTPEVAASSEFTPQTEAASEPTARMEPQPAATKEPEPEPAVPTEPEPAPAAAMEPAPAETAERAPDECRIRVTTGWIKSRAPTLKDCAKLLDQSPENYDSEGYKYAYWQEALLVATKFEVFTFDDTAQWIKVIKRHRY